MKYCWLINNNIKSLCKKWNLDLECYLHKICTKWVYFQSYSICSGLTLASLPPIEAPHSVVSMHISLTALLSHIFFLRLDSIQLPCAPLASTLSYTLFGDSWQSLTCLWRKRAYPEMINHKEMKADVKKIVDTTVKRFFICEDRAVRDCIVLSNAQKILNSLRRMKPWKKRPKQK